MGQRFSALRFDLSRIFIDCRPDSFDSDLRIWLSPLKFRHPIWDGGFIRDFHCTDEFVWVVSGLYYQQYTHFIPPAYSHWSEGFADQ